MLKHIYGITSFNEKHFDKVVNRDGNTRNKFVCFQNI